MFPKAEMRHNSSPLVALARTNFLLVEPATKYFASPLKSISVITPPIFLSHNLKSIDKSRTVINP